MTALDQLFPCDEHCGLPCKTHKTVYKKLPCSKSCGCTDTFFRGVFHLYQPVRTINGEQRYLNQYTCKTMEAVK